MTKNGAGQIPTRACKIVRSVVGNKPIHALGCGGYYNIPLNCYFEATSFDSATTVRRVGDGNHISINYVFQREALGEAKFSKMFVGGYSRNNCLIEEDVEYVKTNKVNDDTELCGCLACEYEYSLPTRKIMQMKYSQ